jgi:hypothetical protein
MTEEIGSPGVSAPVTRSTTKAQAKDRIPDLGLDRFT